MSHKQLRSESEANHKGKMHRMLGGETGLADKRQDEAMIRSAVSQHENQEHGGKHAKLKLKSGGAVLDDNDGDEAKPTKVRMDRPGRARGGKAQHKGAHVNVIVAPQMMHPGGPGMNAALPVPPEAAPHPPVALPVAGPPGPPPMAMGAPGGAAGGPPIGAMAPRVPPVPGAGMMMPRKRGGNVDYPIETGAGGGDGRLDKVKSYGKNSEKGEGRKTGGRAK